MDDTNLQFTHQSVSQEQELLAIRLYGINQEILASLRVLPEWQATSIRSRLMVEFGVDADEQKRVRDEDYGGSGVALLEAVLVRIREYKGELPQ